MQFRTEIKIPAFPFHIEHEHKLMFMGSCFSEHIGNYFSECQFPTLNNPFGILFNPDSIAMALQMAINPTLYTKQYHYKHHDKWVSWAHHGRFSDENYHLFIQNINAQLEETAAWIQNIDHLFITFGTAFYYKFTPENIIVANCHKVPNSFFKKERIDLETTNKKYKELFASLLKINAKLKIILTVSPVRHLGEGFHQNQVSKSLLHLLVDGLVDESNIFYFPSYEILMDDLRDYRFYAHDNCHPNDLSINYIKEKIQESLWDDATCKKVMEITKIQRAMGHIPQKEYQKIIKNR